MRTPTGSSSQPTAKRRRTSANIMCPLRTRSSHPLKIVESWRLSSGYLRRRWQKSTRRRRRNSPLTTMARPLMRSYLRRRSKERKRRGRSSQHLSHQGLESHPAIHHLASRPRGSPRKRRAMIPTMRRRKTRRTMVRSSSSP